MSMANSRGWTPATTQAALLGVSHATIDLASAFIIFSQLEFNFDRQTILMLVLLYNTLAFGGQTLIGLVAGRFHIYRGLAATGTFFAVASLLIAPTWLTFSIGLIGLGNAMFHVGAGAHVLIASGNRAAEAGVFVGPGAVGLFAGIWLGSHKIDCKIVIVMLLVSSAIFAWRVIKKPAPLKLTREKMQTPGLRLIVIAALCLLVSVSIRSLVGGTVSSAWRGVSTDVIMLLAFSACLGKMAGGFVGDRLGWITTSVVALFVSSIFISLLVNNAYAAVLGMLLFQLTMAITLKAMHQLLPQRPGLAFGLPCLALVIGAYPGLLGYGQLMRSWSLTLMLVILSSVIVAAALLLMRRAGIATGPAKSSY